MIMREYVDGLYFGNIMKKKEDKDILIKKDVLLMYDSCYDIFWDFMIVFPLESALKLESERLDPEKIKDFKERIRKNAFPYSRSNTIDTLYVDPHSLRLFTESSCQVNKTRKQ